jgi:hypothetical protein
MTFYDGLKLIQRLKLPHPTWQFVRYGRELKRLAKISAYAGWTIRTAEVRQAAYKNLYVNWLPRGQVSATVDKFQRQLNGRATFIVYPSWRWRKGGAVIVEAGQMVIEATRGAIVDLARQGKVQAQYIYKRRRLISAEGERDILTPRDLKHLLSAADKLKGDSYYFEWGVSTRGKFIIYRLRDLAAEAKALIAKYG